MADFKSLLSVRPLVFLCAGSEFNGDDAWTFHLFKKITGKAVPGITAIWGSTAPENFISSVVRINPAQVIVCDSCDFGKTPGFFSLFHYKEISEQGVFMSHRMPLTSLCSLIEERAGCPVHMLLMQPGRIEFNDPLSKEVKKSLQRIQKEIINCF